MQVVALLIAATIAMLMGHAAEAGLLVALSTAAADGGDGAVGDVAAGATSGGDAPGDGGAPAGQDGGSSGAGAPAGSSDDVSRKKDTRSAAERAYQRALARSKNKGAGAPAAAAAAAAGAIHNPGDSAQAPGGESPSGESSTKGARDDAAAPADTTADEGATPGSTVEAPQDWPEADREAFNKLPNEGRKLVLDIHRRMHAGFTHAMTQLNEERERRKDLFELDARFNSGDHKGVIAELARRAGIEVFFERPLPEGEVPQDVLQDPQKYSQWLRDEVTRQVAARIQEEQRAREEQQAKERAREDFQREWQEAASKFSDFVQHRDAILTRLRQTPSLSVEAAYQLATYEAVAKRAAEVPRLQQELAKVKGELERLKKTATQPPAAASTHAVSAPPDMRWMSPGQRAFYRMKAKRAAAANGKVPA